jgi:hypothetical protein
VASIDDPQATGQHSISTAEIPKEGLSIAEAARLSGLTARALGMSTDLIRCPQPSPRTGTEHHERSRTRQADS